MKKLFGKNQVIITALAIMIAVAGYLSITQDNADDAAKLAGGNDAVTDTNAEALYDISDNISGADGYVLSDNGEIIAKPQSTAGAAESTGDVGDKAAEGKTAEASPDAAAVTPEAADTSASADKASADKASASTDTASAGNVGEAVLVSSVIGSEYFDSAKLSREQTRSKNKEILMEIVNSTATTEAQREKAVTEMLGLTSDSEKETAAEAMLEAKGFGECIVSMVDGSVDVIVNANNLTEGEIAQIQDIVKRKTDAKAKDIVITPVGVNTAE